MIEINHKTSKYSKKKKKMNFTLLINNPQFSPIFKRSDKKVVVTPVLVRINN